MAVSWLDESILKMSPSFGLQLPRKHQKMVMIPGSSMVELSAVNFSMSR
jgi:hypothetical protein